MWHLTPSKLQLRPRKRDCQYITLSKMLRKQKDKGESWTWSLVSPPRSTTHLNTWGIKLCKYVLTITLSQKPLRETLFNTPSYSLHQTQRRFVQMAVKADSSVSLESSPEAVKVQVLHRDGFICSPLQHYHGKHYKPLLCDCHNSAY